MQQTPQYSIGDQLEQFTITKAKFIDELGCIAYELTHDKTGANVIQLQNEDEENTFVISFQTLPDDSTGVAHILEHTVLCGSKKFPVADPFFSMTRRSLSTFMNALTGSDMTCYPAASKVEKDYFNLLEVYLDAVFHPLLNEMSFLQEGHRLKLKDRGKKSEALEIYGIVYNEMKGSMSSNESRLWQKVMEELYPDLPYRHNSGGEPADICNLTYDELLAFHKKFYSPSNAIFFFSGNIPLQKNLAFINKHLLDEAEKTPVHPPLKVQKPFTQPKKSVGTYPCDEENLEDKTYATFAFVTCPIEDQEDLLALCLLDSILMETDASPLKKVLLDSKLCTRADSYMDLEMLQVPIAFVCQNAKEENMDALETLFFDTLKQLKEKPFDQDLIKGAFLSLEFGRLEISSSFGPFALSLFWRSGLLKHHGIDIEAGLLTYSHLKKLKKSLEDPHFLPGLIDKYFLNNPSYVRLTFNPSGSMRKEEEKASEAKLKAQLASMQEKDKEAIETQAQAFEAYQKSLEGQSIECLPKLNLSDIPKKGPEYDLKETAYPSFKLLHHTCFTNHIVYAQLFMDLPAFTQEELPYVKLLCDVLPNLGSNGRSSDENLVYINSYLGSFYCKLNLFEHWGEEDNFTAQWSIGGKAMKEDVSHLISIFHDTLTSAQIEDAPRLKVLLAQMCSAVESSLVKRAMNYATNLSLSTLSRSHGLKEVWYGLSYANFLLSVKKQLDKDPASVIKKLQSVFDKLTASSGKANLVVTCDEASLKTLEPYLSSFSMPGKSVSEPFTVGKFDQLGSCLGRVITSPVAYCSSSFSLGFPSQQAAPFLALSTYIMENLFIHTTIREKGGAYGSGATYLAATNCLTLHSYRDPHIKTTFEAFTKIGSIFTPDKVDDKAMSEAILGMVQDSDSPISPGSRGTLAYGYLMTKRPFIVRQSMRNQILNASASDVIEAVHKFIVPAQSTRFEVALSNLDKLTHELGDREAHIAPCF